MNGKMSIKSREAEMREFENNDDKVILIASMKTGGAGLNLTMANKCIIYDLWWNEAIEQQVSDMQSYQVMVVLSDNIKAYCRLHRIGQPRDVEFVRLIAKDSIDEYIFKLQQQKLMEINQYIGQKNLMSRNSLKELLSMFGDVSEKPGLGFSIKPRKDPVSEEPTGEPVSEEQSGMT
jgi:SNF2 family DNA or RNA helicase